MPRYALLLLISFLISSTSFAKTVYVRDGGGNSAQCTGLTNAVYTSGVSQPCAYSNPGYALGWNCGGGGGSCANAGIISSNDTLSILGDSDTSPGNQAQYYVGYGSPQMPTCSNGGASDCTMGQIPSGVTIIGTGTHRPQIYAPTFPWDVFYAYSNNVTFQNIEITSHQTCGYSSPDATCTNGEGGNRTSDGILLAGSGYTLTDVWIHGMSRYGIVTQSMSGTNTFTRVWLIGNGFGGFTLGNGDSSSNSGTVVFNQPIVEWNGCLEPYPLTSGIDSPVDHKKCYGQANNGYGDGIAFGPLGSQNAGNWTITGPGSISFNTQDGLDTLHGAGSGTLQVDKIRFEGNAGQQVKLNGLTTSLTNSLVIGDCGWWYGSANAGTGWNDTCRALGDAVLFNVTNNSTTYLYNNTVVSNGNIALESEDFNSTGCNGSTVIHSKNNITLAGYAWFDDTTWNGAGGNSQTTYMYNDGYYVVGGGSCANISWDEDYNITYGGRFGALTCNGAHDKCSTSPGFTGSIPMGTAGGAANTYYQGTQGITLVPISSGSAAKGAGVAGLSYWNNSNDYYNVTRSNPPSMGGLEYASCAVPAYMCFYNSDCCGSSCVNNACAGSCTSNGGSCSTGSTCCGGYCCSNICSSTSCSGGQTVNPYTFIGGTCNISGKSYL